MSQFPIRATAVGAFVAVLLVFGLAGGVFAQTWGEFYRHDDNRYWWFRDRDATFEVALPANPAYAIQKDLFGERHMELVLNGSDAFMQLAAWPGGASEAERARQMITGRWSHVLKDVKVTENRTIRTNQNLDAHFTVVQGQTPDGKTAMVRTVLFTAGGRSAYLVWTGLTTDYAGTWQQAWIEAVNSFSWLRR